MLLLKAQLKELATQVLGYRWCGLRLANDKAKNKHFELAKKAF
jgi:hypothetical protein